MAGIEHYLCNFCVSVIQDMFDIASYNSPHVTTLHNIPNEARHLISFCKGALMRTTITSEYIATLSYNNPEEQFRAITICNINAILQQNKC